MDKFSNYAYNLEFVILDHESQSSFNIGPDLKEIFILDDYINNISSVMNIMFIADEELYDILHKRGEQLEYRITLKSTIDRDELNSVLFDDYYMNYLKLKPLTKPANMLKQTKSEDELVANAEYYKYIPVFMSFIPEDVYQSSRLVYNNIFSNCNTKDVAFYLLKDITDRDILMEIPDNTTQYDQIFVPPNNFTNSMKVLQHHYGLYMTGMSIYFKNNYLYIKNKLNNFKTPHQKNKTNGIVYITVDKYNTDIATLDQEGTLYDEVSNTYEYKTSLDHISFYDNTIISEELLGNLNTIYSRSLFETTVKTYSKDINATDEKRKYYDNLISNPMIPTEYFFSTKKSNKLQISYSSANINMWSLENTFKLQIFTNSEMEEEFVDKTYQVFKNEIKLTIENGVVYVAGTAYLNEI